MGMDMDMSILNTSRRAGRQDKLSLHVFLFFF